MPELGRSIARLDQPRGQALLEARELVGEVARDLSLQLLERRAGLPGVRAGELVEERLELGRVARRS
jgi:hypothetical protein